MKHGFTLAELLIALAILGVIATFTIPKVLQSQQDAKSNAIAKETMAMISESYQVYKLTQQPTANFHLADLYKYMNYVSYDTASTIDHVYGNSGTITCKNSEPCLRLHNGAVLESWYSAGGTSGNRFGQTLNNHFVYFIIDIDGQLNSPSTTNGPGKSIDGVLYYNGKVTTYEGCLPGDITYEDGVPGDWCTGTANNPPWFSWN